MESTQVLQVAVVVTIVKRSVSGISRGSTSGCGVLY